MRVLMSAAIPIRSTRLGYRVGAALVGSWLVAAFAQVSVQVPWTPVPFTGQTLAVLLVGACLGSGLGAASLGLYVAQGALGLPFFAGGASGIAVLGLSAPTGGYLLGFIAMAFVVGWLAERGWDRSLRSSIGAMLLGEVVLFAIGVPWLMRAIDVSLQEALELGLYPFVVGDLIKLLAAALLMPLGWRLLGTRGLAGRDR